MDMNDPNSFKHRSEHRAELLREAESNQLARRERMAPQERSSRWFGRRIRAALRIIGETI